VRSAIVVRREGAAKKGKMAEALAGTAPAREGRQSLPALFADKVPKRAGEKTLAAASISQAHEQH